MDKYAVITWNTGRVYKVGEGQRMAAIQDYAEIHFMDFTRMLEGTIPLRGGRAREEYEIKELVMECYDRGVGHGSITNREAKDLLKSYEDRVECIG